MYIIYNFLHHVLVDFINFKNKLNIVFTCFLIARMCVALLITQGIKFFCNTYHGWYIEKKQNTLADAPVTWWVKGNQGKNSD